MTAGTDEPQCTHLISTGQLKMFLACPRRWAMHYPGGLPRGTSEALEFGSLSHTCLEEMSVSPAEWPQLWPSHWTNQEPNKTERDRAKCSVLSQAMYLHHPGGAFISEPTYFLDVPDLDAGGTSFYVKPDGWSDRKVFIDWKSTAATNKRSPWVLHQDDLLKSAGKGGEPDYGPRDWEGKQPLGDDIQFNLYALGLMKRWRTRSITGLWVYGSKKFKPGGMPNTWTVEHSITLKAAQGFFDEVIRPTALIMNAIRRGIESGDIDSPLLVPHVQESCDHRGKFCDVFADCDLAESPIKLAQLGLPPPKDRTK